MVTIAPPLTRVHKLFRHRAIINDLPSTSFDSEIISKILVKRKLSHISIITNQDHMRRGRDHLRDLISLGLVSTVATKNRNKYIKNPISNNLKKYRFKDSFPYDIYETAFFSNQLGRMTLTNPNYQRDTYDDYRCRHILNLLYLLSIRPLNMPQIQYARSMKVDLLLYPKKFDYLNKLFSKYPKEDKRSVTDFVSSYFKTQKQKSEIDRSSVPIIDWLLQAGLVHKDSDNWIHISEKGDCCLDVHKQLTPIWFNDLDFPGNMTAGLLVAYNIAYVQGKIIDPSILKSQYKTPLHNLKDVGLLTKNLKQLRYNISFDLFMAIPPKLRFEVKCIANSILIENKIEPDFQAPLNHTINTLLIKYKQTKEEKNFSDFEGALGLILPRSESFQTEHEWKSCVQCLELELKARPYNGEFEGISDLRIATDNPDFILENGFTTLVECKSIKEWSEILKLDKRVKGEFNAYQEYVEDVGANSALFICEANKLDKKRYLDKFIEKTTLDRIVIVNNNHLLNKKHNKRFINDLKRKLKNPLQYTMDEKILFTEVEGG